MIEKIRRTLGKPVNSASLALFRICFGLALFVSLWQLVAPNSLAFSDNYLTPDRNFPFVGFEWIQPLPPPLLKGVFVALWIGSLCVALGLFYRVAAAVVFLTYTYTFLLETSLYNNHYYLISLLSFLLIWMPADRRFSISSWKNKEHSGTVPYWTVLLLRLQLFIVYFFGGVAKFNADFLSGEPLIGSAQIFADGLITVLPFLDRVEVIVFAKSMAWIGLIFDLSIGFLLWIRRTQWIGIVLLFTFHLINQLTLPIGVFPFLGFTGSLIFLAPDWPVAGWRWIRSRFSKERDEFSRAGKALDSPARASNLVLSFVGGWMLFQTLLPLRHFFIAGDASWTEEGQNFAWRMMLRQKTGGSLVFHLRDEGMFEEGTSGTKIDWSKTPEALRSKAIFVGIDSGRFSWNQNPGINTLYEGLVGFRIVQAVKAVTPEAEKKEIEDLREWWRNGVGEPVDFMESLPLKTCLENALERLGQLDANDAKPIIRLTTEALQVSVETSGGDVSIASKGIRRVNDLLFLALRRKFGEVLHSELARVHPFELLGESTDQRFFVLSGSKRVDGIQEVLTKLGRGDHYLVWCDFERLRNYSWAELPEFFIAFESQELVVLVNYFGKLNRRQAEHLIIKPYMMHQYAQRIASAWEEGTGRRPKIFAHGSVMMNYREPHAIVAADADLAAEKYYLWRHNEWILPSRGERIGISDRISNSR